MLAQYFDMPLNTLNLRVVDHAALLVGGLAEVTKVMKRDRECCTICGFSIPGFMEVDHPKGHVPGAKADSMACICQFCHNLRHPVWAASRKRFVPVFAPDLTQEDLHRLAWVALAWRDAPESTDDSDEPPIDIAAIMNDMAAREQQLTKILKCTAAESFIEAFLSLKEVVTREQGLAAAHHLDQFVRFWPSEVLGDYQSLPRAARLSTWGIGGFKVIATEAAEAIRRTYSPDLNELQKTASAIKLD